MARGRQQKTTGNITAMKADSEFLGAEDIMGRPPVELRIDQVLTYPKGYRVAGREKEKAFPVIVYSRRDRQGDWVEGIKRWIISSKEVRQQLIVRAESVHAQDWRGMVVHVIAEVTRSPKGGFTWGVRVQPTREEMNPEALCAKMARAAATLSPKLRAEMEQPPKNNDEPPQGMAVVPDGRDEPSESPSPPVDRQPGDDNESLNDEPPTDWPGHEQQASE